MKAKALFALGLGLLAGGSWLLTGCASTSKMKMAGGDSEPNGSRLWTQNCIRCHNSRSPSEMSNAQWEVAMLHMRIRANLTAAEHKSILEFLQSGN